MSLPRYVINLSDIIDQLNFKFDSSNNDINKYKTGIRRCKGFRIVNNVNQEIKTWQPITDITLTGITIGTSHESYCSNDTISILINDIVWLDNIYVKNMYQYKTIYSPKLIPKNSTITIIYNKHPDNKNNKSSIWIDLDYIGEKILYTIIVQGYDLKTNSILYEKTYKRSFGNHVFKALEIDGYYLSDKYFKRLEIKNTDSVNDQFYINFNYIQK
mgnify:CR=1 FL=1